MDYFVLPVTSTNLVKRVNDMRTIKVELTIEVPSDYKIDEELTDFGQVCDLLDEMNDRYSNVGLIDGRIIGEQNDGKK